MDLAATTVIVGAAGGVVVDAYHRPIELDLDLTRRWSGVVAASEDLAEMLCGLVRGGHQRLVVRTSRTPPAP